MESHIIIVYKGERRLDIKWCVVTCAIVNTGSLWSLHVFKLKSVNIYENFYNISCKNDE